MIDIDDATIVKRCLEGNTNEYGLLVDRYHITIFNVAYQIVKNYDDAEDITQSSFVKAYEKLDSYNPKYKFFSWLYRIALNESINFNKHNKRKESINTQNILEDRNPEDMYYEKEREQIIRDAVMRLEINYKIPLILKHFLNYTYKELAEVLKIPEKTVKSRLFTARQMLKDTLMKKGIL